MVTVKEDTLASLVELKKRLNVKSLDAVICWLLNENYQRDKKV